MNRLGRAGYQEHVALPDRLEAADAAPVEPDALFKSMLPLHNLRLLRSERSCRAYAAHLQASRGRCERLPVEAQSLRP